MLRNSDKGIDPLEKRHDRRACRRPAPRAVPEAAELEVHRVQLDPADHLPAHDVGLAHQRRLEPAFAVDLAGLGGRELGANASMAAWLYENNGRRLDKAVAVNTGNALMCAATTALICCYR